MGSISLGDQEADKCPSPVNLICKLIASIVITNLYRNSTLLTEHLIAMSLPGKTSDDAACSPVSQATNNS